MNRTLLLTSFTTWKAHQVSNSSDDLLDEISNEYFSSSLHFLRRLPVDFHLAPQLTLQKVDELQPDVTLLCGMAENRIKLNIESRAVINHETVKTSVEVEKLVSGLTHSEISHDTGKFVCNRLYYETLKHLQNKPPEKTCIFIHVPVLNQENKAPIRNDFLSIIERLSSTR